MGLARCSRQQARAVLSARVPGGPLTQFASERIWAPAERLSVTVAGGAASSPLPRAPVRLRSRQSRRRLRRSTRSQSGPRPPASAARTPYPDSPPRTRSGDSASGRRGGCLRASGRGAGFSAVATGFSRRAVPAGLPDPGLGTKVARGLGHQAGRARRGRAGGIWGLRKAQCRGPSSRAGARQSSLGRAGQGQGRRAEPLGAGARVGARPLSLPGQRGFPRAREAAQEVEVFSKAVAARRWPPRGQRPRRRLLLPLLEAQPPERFQKTVLHGEGAGGEGPGLPS